MSTVPIVSGRVAWIFPDNFDVDLICGADHLHTFDLEVLRGICMRSFEPGFGAQVRQGDVLVGGRNFGHGQPHDMGMLVMRDLGIEAIVAESFAPMFQRGMLFEGFPLVSCPGIAGAVRRWDELSVDFEGARVTLADRRVLEADRPPAGAVEAVAHRGGAAALAARIGT